jgi:hypothetical protein
MVREHDSTSPNTDGFCSLRDMTDHNRRRGACDALHVVMLGDPDTAIAPSLGMNCNVTRVGKRTTRIGILRHADEVEDG